MVLVSQSARQTFVVINDAARTISDHSARFQHPKAHIGVFTTTGSAIPNIEFTQ